MALGLDPNEALGLVNEYRLSKGLPALSLESHATAAAAILAKDMANHDQMSPPWPERRRSSEASDHVGIPLQGRGGKCQRRPEVLCPNRRGVETKPASQPKFSLLADAKHMGIAYEYKPDTKYKTYWTLVVAAP